MKPYSPLFLFLLCIIRVHAMDMGAEGLVKTSTEKSAFENQILEDGQNKLSGHKLYKLGNIAPNFCGKAVDITCGQLLKNQSTIGAGSSVSTADYGLCLPYSPFGFSASDKVYKITVTEPSKLQVNLLIKSVGKDLDLFLFNGCSGEASCLASSILSSYYPLEQISRQVNPGTYYIVVDGYDALQEGIFNLSVTCKPLDCTGATVLTCGVPYKSTNSTGVSNASIYKLPTCVGCAVAKSNETGKERVHRFVLTTAQFVLITLNGLSSDLDLFLLNTCDQDKLTACSYNAGNNPEVIYTYLNAGTYYVVVDGYDGASGNYTLTATYSDDCSSSQPDYFCGSAINVQCGQLLASQKTLNNVISTSSYACFGLVDGFSYNGSDRSYKLQLNKTENLELKLEINADTDLDLFLFNNCEGVPNSCIAASTNRNGLFTGPLEEEIFITLPPGDYYIVVDGDNPAQVGFDLTINCGELDCNGAVPLSCGVSYTSNNNTGANNVGLYSEDTNNDGKSEIIDIGYIFRGPEKVYQFILTEFQEVTITMNNLSQNLDLFLLGSCDKRNVIARSILTGLKEEKIVIPLKAGTYYVVVDAREGNTGSYTLTVDGYCELTPFCNEAIQVNCGQGIYDLNNGTAGVVSKLSNANYSGCLSNGARYDAPDYVFAFQATSFQTMKVRLEITGNADLDLFLLDGCYAGGEQDPSSIHCLASSTGSGNIESLDEFLLAEGTYYIVVDGKSVNDIGLFNLILDCSCTCMEMQGDEPYGSVILCDNFESYIPGNLDPQSSRWAKRTESSGDATVASMQDGQYLQVGNGQDVVYELGVFGGRLRLSWEMVVTPEKTASYAILNGPGSSDFAAVVTFEPDGTGKLRLGNQEPGSFVEVFSYLPGDTLRIMHMYDEEPDIMEFWVDGNFIHSWDYADNTISKANKLAGLNFFGQSNTSYTVDDFCLRAPTWCISSTSLPQACVKNGSKYQTTALARCALYAAEEYEYCQSVCDLGGVAVFRGQDFTGALESNNPAPVLLKSEPCIREFYGGTPPDPLFADIYVYQHDGQTDVLDFTLSEAAEGTGLFAFFCQPDETGNPFQICLGSAVEGIFSISEPPVGFYYIVITGNAITDYILNISPEGDCGSNPVSIDPCNTNISGNIDGEFNDFDKIENKLDAYTCYSGSRTYTGDDTEFQFVVEYPGDFTFELDAAAPMGLFLFGNTCGRNCIKYAENLLSGGKAFFTERLTEGIYYLVVDKGSSNGSGAFTLSVQCEQDTKIDYIYDFEIPDDIYCPTDTIQDSLHRVTIRKTAFPLKANRDKIQFYYRNNAGAEIARDTFLKTWSTNDLVFYFPEDLPDDDIMCSYRQGDSLFIGVQISDNGATTFKKLYPSYQEPNNVTVTAKGFFKKGGISRIVGLTEESCNLNITPRSVFSPIASQIADSFFVISNAPWDVEIMDPGTASWLSVSSTSGNPGDKLVMYFDPNTELTPRNARLRVRTRGNCVLLRDVTIEQQGLCLPPVIQLIPEGPLTICAGDSAVVKVSGGADIPWRYQWSTGIEFIDSITVKPVGPSTIEVRVTHPQCDATGLASIQIVEEELPATPTGAADQTYCSLEDLPSLSIRAQEGFIYDWYDLPQAGTILPGGLGTDGSFIPSEMGTYYVQARSTAGCVSESRAQVILEEVPAPDFEVVSTTCSSDLFSYTAVFSLSKGQPQINLGTIENIGEQYTVSGIPADSTLRIQVLDAGCVSVPEFVLESPGCACPSVSSPVSGGDVTICSTDEAGVELTAAVGSPELTIDWYDQEEAGEPLSGGLGSLTFLPANPGVYYAQARDTVSGCKSAIRIPVELKVEQAAIADAGQGQVVCAGQSIQLSGLIGGSAQNGGWTASVSGGTFSPNPGSPNATYTPPAGVTEVLLTLSTDDPPGVCEGVSDQMLIQVQAAVMAFAGADQSICAGESIPLSGTIGGVATNAHWTASAQGGSFSPDANALNAVYTPPANATLVRLALMTDDPSGPCPSAVDQMELNIQPKATVMAGTTITSCEGQSVSLNGTVGGSATSGTWSASFPGGVFVPGAQDLNATYTPPAGAGEVVLTLETNDPPGACPATSASINLSIASAARVDVGADQTVCTGQEVSLSALLSGSAVQGVWTSSVAGGIFQPEAGSKDIVYLPAAGAENLVLTFTTNDPDGPCPSAADQVMIRINKAAVVEAGEDLAVCEGGQVQLSGDIGGSAIAGEWSASVAGGIFIPNNQSLDAVFTPPAGVGEIILSLKTNDPAGPCEATTDLVKLLVDAAALVDAGLPQTVCKGDTIQLDGKIGGSASTVIWTSNLDGGEFFPSAAAPDAKYLPPADATSLRLILSTDDPQGPCPAVNDQVTFAFNTLPTLVNTGFTCSPDLETYNLTVAGDADELVSNGGEVVLISEGIFGINGIPKDSAAEITAIHSLTGCRNILSISAPNCACPPMAAPVNLGDKVICAGEPIPALMVTTQEGQTVDWYDKQEGGEILLQGSSSYTPVQQGVFYAQTRTDLNGCTSLSRTPVRLTIKSLPQANAGPDKQVCPGAELVLSAQSIEGHEYQWSNGISNPAVRFIANEPEVLVLQVSFDGCVNRDTVAISLLEQPSVTIDTISEISCYDASDGRIGLQISGGKPPYSLNWSNGSRLPIISNLAAGKYAVVISDEQGCKDSVETFLLSPDPLKIVDTIIRNVSSAQDTGIIVLKVQGGRPPYRYRWLVDQFVIAESDSLKTNIAGQYIVEIKDDSGCILIDTFEILRVTSLSSHVIQDMVKIYPNPTGGIVHIEWLSDQTESLILEVLDALGRSFAVPGKTRYKKGEVLEIDLSSRPEGLYIIRIKKAGKYFVEKILLHK